MRYMNNTEEQLMYHADMSNNNEAQPNDNAERISDTHNPDSEYNNIFTLQCFQKLIFSKRFTHQYIFIPV